MKYIYIIGISAIIILTAFTWLQQAGYVWASSADFGEVKRLWTPKLREQFTEKNLEYGNPIYIRIFKETNELELWVKAENDYQLFKTYDICYFSGELGPKLKEGDHQAPEGFYNVAQSAMNPNSSYHLSFNMGFPNQYDLSHERTGSYLMVHGKCVSIGCFAMTDEGIEEIYTIAEAALGDGLPSFPVHSFPFRMTEENMTEYSSHEWIEFWNGLKPVYDYFETHKKPPEITVLEKNYQIVESPSE